MDPHEPALGIFISWPGNEGGVLAMGAGNQSLLERRKVASATTLCAEEVHKAWDVEAD